MLAIRVPRDGEPRPSRTVTVPTIDTGGAWRAPFRAQNPNTDPAEPGGGESNSAGNDHGWTNCTMSAGAMAYGYEDHDTPWGGNMRHAQDDLSGGTDLNDLKQAWQRYGGKSLTIRSGAGWQAVVDAHNEGRAIVIQGEGDCPGGGDFTGSHACCIAPEDNGSNWLWGDPDTSGWQWVTPGSIKSWAERLNSSILFAVGKAGEMDDIVVTDATPKIVDLPSGIPLLNIDGSVRNNSIDSAKSDIYSPFQSESASGSRIRAVVYPSSSGSDVLLYAYYGDCTNMRDLEGDGDIAARDEEWREWLLSGSPGSNGSAV